MLNIYYLHIWRFFAAGSFDIPSFAAEGRNFIQQRALGGAHPKKIFGSAGEWGTSIAL